MMSEYYNTFKSSKAKLTFSFALMILLSACGQPNKEIYQDSWKEDVLVGQDCGLSGLTCCFDSEKKCEQGLECCVDPLDQAKGYCGETCDYGKIDKYCRKDEPRCDGTAICKDDYCAECGITNNPCCKAQACNDQNKKDLLHAECINDICIQCGHEGEVSCASEFKCAPGNLNNGGNCLKCGGPTQPCCEGENFCDKGLKCQLGFCS